MTAATELHIEPLDPETVIIFISVPTERVVLFQAYFELYEGIGVVRTLDLSRSLLSILTTETMKPRLLEVLDGTRSETGWEPAAVPEDLDREAFLGYHRKLKGVR